MGNDDALEGFENPLPLESVFKRDTIQLQGGSMLYSNLPLPLGEGWGEG